MGEREREKKVRKGEEVSWWRGGGRKDLERYEEG